MALDKEELSISIGVLAHNEAPRIERTLISLLKQDVFRNFPTELVVIANGCTDNTAEIARNVVTQFQKNWESPSDIRVEEIATAGKANAWNEFVHRVSSRKASALVLMDADINIINPDSITSLITTLRDDPVAVVCLGQALKDIELKSSLTFFERSLLRASPRVDSEILALCGQLYCIDASEARKINLPIGITVDDGFIRALLLTFGFTRPEDAKRIAAAPRAVHSFAAVATIRELFKHEKWIVAGNIVNMMLFERFWSETPSRSQRHAANGAMAGGRPALARNYVSAQVRMRGWRTTTEGDVDETICTFERVADLGEVAQASNRDGGIDCRCDHFRGRHLRRAPRQGFRLLGTNMI